MRLVRPHPDARGSAFIERFWLQQAFSCMKYIENEIRWVNEMDVLVIDGYNVINASEELTKLQRKDIELARNRLIEHMQEYHAYTKIRVIIVFDALYVKGIEQREQANGVEVIYTREDETADECIERLVKQLKTIDNEVYVATSDYLEQRTIFSRGALRMSARELLLELEQLERTFSEEIEANYNKKTEMKITFPDEVKAKLEKIRRRKSGN